MEIDEHGLEYHEGAQLFYILIYYQYELALVRNSEFEKHQVAFTIFQQADYHTSDLLFGTRIHQSRTCGGGQRELTIGTAALVVGARRFQAPLMISLNSSKDLALDERAVMIEKLWPSIQEANAVCPAHARIAKTHIFFSTQEKPMLRTAKGTMQRAGTLAQYHQELEDLYADVEKVSGHTASFDKRGFSNNPDVLSQYIRESLLEIAGWTDELSDTENCLARGLDSLQIITATRILRQGLNLPDLNPSIIYLHPTVKDLTEAVLWLHQEGEQSSKAYNKAQLQEREKLLRGLVGQMDVSSRTKSHVGKENSEQSVILTGSTGNLGTFILDALLKNDL
ncbi:NRPS-like enzyme [Penicillium angulare]|uniref:NRPS-like enzyme n=1 Tax=Penicillium angulare TaxID=116970 RepID=UPI002541062F|nr:NRPS-like enzyme [Penicillium angulare]KAJ5257216.1 NRPS-like enzyme [Penicillium angulare]